MWVHLMGLEKRGITTYQDREKIRSDSTCELAETHDEDRRILGVVGILDLAPQHMLLHLICRKRYRDRCRYIQASLLLSHQIVNALVEAGCFLAHYNRALIMSGRLPAIKPIKQSLEICKGNNGKVKCFSLQIKRLIVNLLHNDFLIFYHFTAISQHFKEQHEQDL